MKNVIYLLLFRLALPSTLLLSCHKEGPPTIIMGIVTNKTTGEPVAGAFLDCSLNKPEWESGRVKDNSTYSDENGKYYLEIPQEYNFSLSNTYKKGYLPKVDPAQLIEIQIGETNVVDVALIPNDGFLRLKFENNLTQNDSLFIYFFNPIIASQYALSGWVTPPGFPIILANGASYQGTFEFPSESFTTFYWGTQAFNPQVNAPLRDSVYLHRNDTIDFAIHF